MLLDLIQHGVESAIKEIQTRVSEAQSALQKKSLKGKKRDQAEEDLKNLTEQLYSAQHELETCEVKAATLMKKKTDLANRLKAKMVSAEKFRKHEL